MYYLEQSLRRAGVAPPSAIAFVRTPGEDWAAGDLRAELADVFPHASFSEWTAHGTGPAADLYVLPVAGVHDFPFHDVLYGQLDAVADVLGTLPRTATVLVYRVRWREAEVVRTADLWRWRAARRLEALAIALLGRETPLRRLFRPLS